MAAIISNNTQGKPAWGGWKPVTTPAPASLAVLMDEEVAKELHREETFLVAGPEPSVQSEPIPVAVAVAAPVETNSDEQIAAQLQEQFDREHDEELRKLEKHMNGKSSVTISLSNFNRSHYSQSSGSAEDDDEDDEEDMPMPVQARTSPNSGGGGGGGGPGRRRRPHGGASVPTKHDPVISGRRNARAAEERLPPSMAVGTLVASDGTSMKIDNRTYNGLVKFSQQGGRKSARVRETRDHSTMSHNLDAKTVGLIKKMVNNGRISEMGGLISQGKEATVYHAFGPNEEDEEFDDMLSDGESLPERPKNSAQPSLPEYAVKVFKTTLAEFKTRGIYIQDDMRFKDRLKSQNSRTIMHIWAEKEMRNLQRLQKAVLPCPEPIFLNNHILVMTFIGRDGVHAPQLRDARLTAQQMQRAYEQSLVLLTRMYKECKLVHADFSPFNLLWHEQRLFVIDVSQSVEPWHQDAMRFLYRDVENLLDYFRKMGVRGVATIPEVIQHVTGFHISSSLSEKQYIEELCRRADQTNRGKRGGAQHGSSPPEESFTDMYERAVIENARTRAEKEARAALECDDGEDDDTEESSSTSAQHDE
ncbi:serine/threonine-protein kinase RIO3-like [Sycon ciliatum]|uniref:serine/threonine-protein kinase RIO3-like n=1 Tax=Sycon ciliatum TaxID=27933 RepID=UPI0031F6C822